MCEVQTLGATGEQSGIGTFMLMVHIYFTNILTRGTQSDSSAKAYEIQRVDRVNQIGEKLVSPGAAEFHLVNGLNISSRWTSDFSLVWGSAAIS